MDRSRLSDRGGQVIARILHRATAEVDLERDDARGHWQLMERSSRRRTGAVSIVVAGTDHNMRPWPRVFEKSGFRLVEQSDDLGQLARPGTM